MGGDLNNRNVFSVISAASKLKMEMLTWLAFAEASVLVP